MTFADLLAGDAVFVDANVLSTTSPLIQFFKHLAVSCCSGSRTKKSGLYIFAHSQRGRAPSPDPGGASGASVVVRKAHPAAQTKPAVLQTLTKFRTAIEHIVQSQIVVLASTPALMVTATGLCQQPGLLITDALSVAVMQANGLTKITSDDADFDRVPGITRYAPA